MRVTRVIERVVTIDIYRMYEWHVNLDSDEAINKNVNSDCSMYWDWYTMVDNY